MVPQRRLRRRLFTGDASPGFGDSTTFSFICKSVASRASARFSTVSSLTPTPLTSCIHQCLPSNLNYNASVIGSKPGRTLSDDGVGETIPWYRRRAAALSRAKRKSPDSVQRTSFHVQSNAP